MALLPRKIPLKTKKMVQTIFIFLIVIIIFSFSTQINPFSGIIHGFQYGFSGLGTGVKSTYNYIFESRADLQEKLDYYQNLTGTLAHDEVYVKELEQNLTELQSLISYQESIEYTTLPARIISRSISGNQAVLIDKGKNAGVRLGLAVVIENGNIIGTVTEVYNNSAVVLLIHDSESKVPGAILGSTKTIGLIEGQDGYLLAMNYIPQSEKLFLGDVVATSGLDGSVPSGLIIGLVSSIIADESAPFQQALIEPIYDPGDFTNVLILDPFQND
ncbi:rod shape-determining protein MreC [Candidatus Uhrbacteria bacterium CG_4_9_14_0_8_um_filter_41_16]|nr:MAG: rod shape-determining protein MreC [Candidatus Uhrbacteria bacterium CG_4_10_14_3_um_filter_41_21]PIZ54387.1 MAG: rod shape-determining protein MreC [Candidatus Uhrbacteria bacterium CG_4_10_14_0_2_um_filter_41_21]PJB84985.1 MAG: rod shape-determining protein MreC [Candidatus Uhrbacteria bacterium CG_4_9_14_0_8_um_filter_41_16]